MKNYLHWKTYLVFFALVLAIIALYHTNTIVKEMETEERNRVQILVNAIKAVSETEISDMNQTSVSNSSFTFATQVIEENTTIPIIATDQNDQIVFYKNLNEKQILKNPLYLPNKLKEFRSKNGVIEIDFNYGKQYIQYGESDLLIKLKNYPLILFTFIFVFLIIVIVALLNAQKSIQNQVWVGMSKETAHQLGTPLSSIVGWMELLKEKEDIVSWINEMEKDVGRLQLVADRFSKIGSTPQLTVENLVPLVQNMVTYMQKRSPHKVQLHFKANESEIETLISAPLFDWVIENLIRNGLDALEGEGNIWITMTNEPRTIIIDVKDTGKGIPKNKFKKVFNPGFSTKKRGWGLGLSLAKRIIEKYHNGSIFVKQSELKSGTTFRIILRR